MAFSRSIQPAGARPSGEELTAQMVGIGMAFAGPATPNANIEDVLLYASEVGMLDGDLRVLSVLAQWLGTHAAYINADRLVRMLKEHPETRVRAFWSSVGSWLGKDRRLARLVGLHGGDPVDVLSVGTDFQLSRRGVDERFAESALRVPAGTLRERRSDVLSPAQLARLHLGYRNRVRLGPSWRADVWTALELEPTLSVAEVARRAHCAFGTAWHVKRDYELLESAMGTSEGPIAQSTQA